MRTLRTASLAIICSATISIANCGSDEPVYGKHRHVPATVFWVGEAAGAANGFIANKQSAWDGHWQRHFGGIDTPYRRVAGGKWPAGFKPRENPFYVALPYSEFTDSGAVRPDARGIPWYNPAYPPAETHSILKNHWVAVSRNGRTVYVQWEDVGPFKTDDFAYVFGTAMPQYKPSGIDLSPAAAHYLGIRGKGTVSWWFVSPRQVPPGPWREIITSRQVSR